MTSVFIVAAVPALRAGLRAMLEHGAITVVDDAADAPPSTPADVLVVAADRPPEDLPEAHPLVLLSNDGRQATALEALGLPGWALLPTDVAEDALAAAITAVAAGLVVLPTGAAQLATPDLEISDPLQEPLTPRELEVLQLVSQGLSNKLIARELRISEHTVKFHVSSTYAKLGAASRTEAVSVAARKGLVSL